MLLNLVTKLNYTHYCITLYDFFWLYHNDYSWFLYDLISFWFIMQLKKSYHIATNVCSRKGATGFGYLSDWLGGRTRHRDIFDGVLNLRKAWYYEIFSSRKYIILPILFNNKTFLFWWLLLIKCIPCSWDNTNILSSWANIPPPLWKQYLFNGLYVLRRLLLAVLAQIVPGSVSGFRGIGASMGNIKISKIWFGFCTVATISLKGADIC